MRKKRKRDKNIKKESSISYHALVSGQYKGRYVPSARELRGAVKSGRAKKEVSRKNRWAVLYDDSVYITDNRMTNVITVLTPVQYNTLKFYRLQEEGRLNKDLIKKNFGITI